MEGRDQRALTRAEARAQEALAVGGRECHSRSSAMRSDLLSALKVCRLTNYEAPSLLAVFLGRPSDPIESRLASFVLEIRLNSSESAAAAFKLSARLSSSASSRSWRARRTTLRISERMPRSNSSERCDLPASSSAAATRSADTLIETLVFLLREMRSRWSLAARAGEISRREVMLLKV
jgi:hypothetical protein